MSVQLVASDGGASLGQVSGAADASNHAIPTSKELSRSFTKLVSVGAVDMSQDRFFIAKQFVDEVAYNEYL
jgi:hypothetical protein